MAVPTVEAFRAWHDFYVLLGTGAATLIGAMFVVVSIGSSFLTKKSEPQIRAFMTPTSFIWRRLLLGSVLAMVPAPDGPPVSVGFALTGIAGLLYSGRIGLDIAGRADLFVDRIWYGVIPMVGYAMILAAAVLLVVEKPGAFETLALGLVLLLIASIRNSWDMIVFFAQRTGGPS